MLYMALDGPSLAVQHEELRICCLNATDEGGTKTKTKKYGNTIRPLLLKYLERTRPPLYTHSPYSPLRF
jgi:hypothetical protein